MTKSLEFYNKNLQALRQEDEAEKMIRAGGYANARDKLLETLDFFSLDRVLPMLTVCDILLASSYQLPGIDTDHYRILRLVPSSSPQDIALRYNKLQNLLLLQPMKGSFPEATESALKFIQEAFLVLSNSEKRGTFDSLRKAILDGYDTLAVDFPECPEKGADLTENALSSNSEMDLIEVADDDSPIIDPSSSSSKEVHQDFFDFDEGRNIDSMEVGEIWAARDHHRYVQIKSKSGPSIVVTRFKPVPLHDREKKWCEAGLPVGCGSFSLDLDSGEILISPVELSHKCTWIPSLTQEEFSIYPRKSKVWAVHDEAIASFKYPRLVEILSDCSNYIGGIDCAFLEKVEGFRAIFRRKEGISIGVLHLSPSDFYLLSHKLPAIRLTGKEADGIESGMWEVDHLSVPNDICTLPYGIASGQVWAVSRGNDSSPRQYVAIDNVVSNTQVLVTFLEPESKTKLEMNFPITCGRFKRGGTTVYLEASELSYLLRFEENTPSFDIYPRKGEIWAMYSDWEASGCENCKYRIVEILSESSDGDNKMMVARLKEVEGCLTFFQRFQTDGFSLTSEISETEMLGFSHRIRFCKVPKIDSCGVPENCYHLEPDDLPQKRSNFL